ncbi:hypothetical protein OHZ10_11970 [Burkholderia arboris]|uniref:Uncharacterized protein n=1 Tax=Burkholderia arboris TaxID=488730 RepID=A0ABZ3DEK0_9BURK
MSARQASTDTPSTDAVRRPSGVKQSVTISGIARSKFFQITFYFLLLVLPEKSGFSLHQGIGPRVTRSVIEVFIEYITKRMAIERFASLDAPHRRHLLSVCRP